jgi:ataxin-3
MNDNIDFKRKFVYFEKQQNDRLCGLHCINSLVQGPLFDAVQLSMIAQGLDEMEKKLYEEDIDINAMQVR